MSNLSTTVIDAIQDKKGNASRKSIFPDRIGSGFRIRDMRGQFHLPGVGNRRQHPEEVYRQKGLKPYNYDGYRNSQWIVIDYGTLMVHIFLPDVREYYNIEDLWSDAGITHIPDLD